MHGHWLLNYIKYKHAMTSFSMRVSAPTAQADFKGFVWLRGTGWNTLQTAEESAFHGALEFQPSWPGNHRKGMTWSACPTLNVSLHILPRHACRALYKKNWAHNPGKRVYVILEVCPDVHNHRSSKPLCGVNQFLLYDRWRPARLH